MSEIIAEADILVPTGVLTADKVVALTAINQDFFNVVKIPKIIRFTGTKEQAEYSLDAMIREKNIDLVKCGLLKYKNLNREDVKPTENNFVFDDETSTLSLSPAPYQNGLAGILRTHRIATTTFSAGVLTATPDAPVEYHWTFIPALAAFLANTMDDAAKATNYESQYKAAWNVAAQNYQMG